LRNGTPIIVLAHCFFHAQTGSRHGQFRQTKREQSLRSQRNGIGKSLKADKVSKNFFYVTDHPPVRLSVSNDNLLFTKSNKTSYFFLSYHPDDMGWRYLVPSTLQTLHINFEVFFFISFSLATKKNSTAPTGAKRPLGLGAKALIDKAMEQKKNAKKSSENPEKTPE
jgi:hypothetical protein